MDAFEISVELPVRAEKLYDAWLSSTEHSAFTGGEAVIKMQTKGLSHEDSLLLPEARGNCMNWNSAQCECDNLQNGELL